MKALCLTVLCVSLTLGLFGSAAHAQPASKPAADAPVKEAETLGLAMADALEKSTDCSEIGPKLDAVLASHSSEIQALSAAKRTSDGLVSADHQKRLLAMAEKAKGCAGKVQSPALDNLRTALAAYGKRAKPTELASSAWCEEECCIKGWETWAAVTLFTAACLAGDNNACCLATTIASYDLCVEELCPVNRCCQDVPPGPAPKK